MAGRLGASSYDRCVIMPLAADPQGTATLRMSLYLRSIEVIGGSLHE